MTKTWLPVWMVLAGALTATSVAADGIALQVAAPPAPAQTRPQAQTQTKTQTQARSQAQPQAQTQQDEYARYELLAPETASFTLTLDVAATTPGATSWVTRLESGPKGKAASSVSAVDMLTGQPLKFLLAPGSVRVTLARPITGDGGQARIRVRATIADPRAYSRARGPGGAGLATDGEVIFTQVLAAPRNAVVLPAGYQVTACNIQSQVLSLADGRTQVSFMHQGPGPVTLEVKARPGARTGQAAAPRPLTNARSWEPPPSQGPTERARLSERASQDRDIVYFLQPPDSHAFSLYHDYTETREGSDKYLNVVRTGSTVSSPSGLVLDTGEAMKVEVLKGAQLKAAGIETPGDQVADDTEVVVFRYPAVKAGQSLRLRLSETYTAPQSYRVDGDDLVFERSFGRPRNSVVLPKGWYLTALSIPGVIRQTPTGETRIDFVNPRPDSIDVLIKGRKAEK